MSIRVCYKVDKFVFCSVNCSSDVAVSMFCPCRQFCNFRPYCWLLMCIFYAPFINSPSLTFLYYHKSHQHIRFLCPIFYDIDTNIPTNSLHCYTTQSHVTACCTLPLPVRTILDIPRPYTWFYY